LVTEVRQGTSIGQLEIPLRPLQRLDRGLFVDAEHNGLFGRSDIEADDVGGFGREVRVVVLAPGLASLEIDPVAPQEPYSE
jgi:hypothetical protein